MSWKDKMRAARTLHWTASINLALPVANSCTLVLKRVASGKGCSELSRVVVTSDNSVLGSDGSEMAGAAPTGHKSNSHSTTNSFMFPHDRRPLADVIVSRLSNTLGRLA